MMSPAAGEVRGWEETWEAKKTLKVTGHWRTAGMPVVGKEGVGDKSRVPFGDNGPCHL